MRAVFASLILIVSVAAELHAEPSLETAYDQGAQGEAPIHSDERPVSLRSGMGFHEVIRLLGPPIERREHEANRETTWEYPSQKIFFKNGRVVAWAPRGQVLGERRVPAGDGAENSENRESKVIRGPENGQGTAPDDETIRQILGEILNAPTPPGISAK